MFTQTAENVFHIFRCCCLDDLEIGGGNVRCAVLQNLINDHVIDFSAGLLHKFLTDRKRTLIGAELFSIHLTAHRSAVCKEQRVHRTVADIRHNGKSFHSGNKLRNGGASFISFKEYYAEREIFDYIRSMRTGFTVQSLAEYAKLRKAMAVWDKYDRSYADATLEAVAVELGETTDDTKEILLGGFLNENRADLYQQYAEDDEAESTEEAHPDTTSDTYSLYMKGELYARLWDAYDKLEYTERMMLAQRIGFCFDCHSTFYMDYDDLDEYGEPKKKPIKPMMYTDIAIDHEYSSANTAHKKCEKALAKLKEAIKDLI